MNDSNSAFDVIVIGSGMGGLTCASLLSQLGRKRVLVLERHFKLGGFTHTFDRNGYRWDVGVHYVGQMAQGQQCRQLFDLITRGNVEWFRMPDKFDVFTYPDFEFAVDADPEIFKADLIKRFPDEAAGIKQYFIDLPRVVQWFENRIVQSMMPFPFNSVMHFAEGSMRQMATQTTQTYLNSLFRSVELKALLCSQWGDCGVPPSMSPLALHALIACHYFGGGYYPCGSAKSIADAVVNVVKAQGGDCLTNHTVTDIIVEDGRAKGVKVLIARGDNREKGAIFAPKIVSNAGYAITFGKLVPPDYRVVLPAEFHKDIRSCVTAYIGFKSSPEVLGIKGENHWIFDSYDHDNMFNNTLSGPTGKAGGCFLSFPSLKDPAAKKHTAELTVLVKFEEFAGWSDTSWQHRGSDYEAFKQQLANKLLDIVEKKFPGFGKLVEYIEVSTPLSVADFTGHPDGAIYGYPLTSEEFKKRSFSPATPIKDLYMTGTDTVTLGIMGAAMGGIVTASHLMGGLAGFLKIMVSAKQFKKPL